MTGKSRRGRGKYSAQSKKRKGRPARSAVPARPPAVPQAGESVASPGVPVPSPSAPTPIAKLATVRHPYIATELRTIGILGGIMLVVLVVLAFVLS